MLGLGDLAYWLLIAWLLPGTLVSVSFLLLLRVIAPSGFSVLTLGPTVDLFFILVFSTLAGLVTDIVAYFYWNKKERESTKRYLKKYGIWERLTCDLQNEEIEAEQLDDLQLIRCARARAEARIPPGASKKREIRFYHSSFLKNFTLVWGIFALSVSIYLATLVHVAFSVISLVLLLLFYVPIAHVRRSFSELLIIETYQYAVWDLAGSESSQSTT